MTVVLDGTIGGAGANTYVLDGPATAWAEAEVDGAVFSALSAAVRAALLVRARRRLDEYFAFPGTPVDDVQACQWPRIDVERPTGTFYLTTEIPQAVKDAQCALAAWLASQGTTTDPFAPSDGITSLTVDVISLDYGTRAPDAAGVAFLDDRVAGILMRAGCLSGASSAQFRLVR